MQGVRKFILRGNVVDLAVGVVIGAAFAQARCLLLRSRFRSANHSARASRCVRPSHPARSRAEP